VVKIEVTGTKPDGKTTVSRVGTGFFINSANGYSLLLTAAHVIGSNEISQSKNDDWLVENGTINRKIKIRVFNDHGTLDSGSLEAYSWNALPGAADIAVLSIDGAPYPTVPLTTERDVGLRSAMLLGFLAQEDTLAKPLPTGKIEFDHTSFRYRSDFNRGTVKAALH